MDCILIQYMYFQLYARFLLRSVHELIDEMYNQLKLHLFLKIISSTINRMNQS